MLMARDIVKVTDLTLLITLMSVPIQYTCTQTLLPSLLPIQ